MDLFQWSETCFTATALAYVAATVLYLIYMGWRNRLLGELAFTAAVVGVLFHTLQNEPMVSIGVPTATTGQNLDDDEWPFQLPSPADRSLKGEAPSRPPRRCDPVDNERPIRLRWSVVQ